MSLSCSVVIPAYEEAARLRRCLDPLTDQDAEVLVVVGGDDETEVIAGAHEACDVVLRDVGTGAGAARNRGVEAAIGDVVLFTDADTVVPTDWVELHRRHYADPEVIGVGGPARPLEGGLKDRLLFKLLSDYWYRISWPVGIVQLPTFNCSYRTSVFREHGWFDEELQFMEDTELSLRLKDVGVISYDPATCVRTSARRERREGYWSVFLTYLRTYVRYYLFGRDPRGDYFESQRD